LVCSRGGYAKLAGMDFIVHPVRDDGLGNTFLMIAGTVEIVAGLCLLYRARRRRRGACSRP